MAEPQTRAFPASAEALAAVCDFVDSWSAGAGLVRDTALKLRLVVEELFLNVALHGYREPGGTVGIALRDLGDAVVLSLEDSAPAFDPFADAVAVAASANPAERPVGRLGIPLVMQLAAQYGYQRCEGRNRVELRLPR